MKLINSKGRVLLEVYSACATGLDDRGFIGVTYQYRGDGCGGNVDIVGLYRTIECIRMDAPSAKPVGYLPEPKLPAPLENETVRSNSSNISNSSSARGSKP